MNDRYLFRAKRTDNGECVKGSLCYKKAYCFDNRTKPKAVIITEYSNTGVVNFDIDENTICQCTGLKDKNGKLIWENDIMVAHLDDRFPEDATYTRVVWNNNGFCTKEQGSEDILPLDKFDQEYFEVIGNRFDNPELLEVGEMTEQEAIKDISENIKPYVGGKSLDMAIKALEEVQQYRAIGTKEECRAAVEKQKAIKPLGGKDLDGNEYDICRECSAIVSDGDWHAEYCPDCGQKVDWNDD